MPMETPENILKAYGTSTIIATCPAGQRFERERIGFCYDDIRSAIEEAKGYRPGFKVWIEERLQCDPENRGEDDFGVHWTDGLSYPRWRVSWIRSTGEVYAFEQSHRDVFIIFGVVETDEEIERLLDGWSVTDMKLDWIRERVHQ